MMTAIGAGCGGDDAEKPASGANSGASGRAADGDDADKGKTCGTKTCTVPEPAGDLTACCLDPFTSMCGVQKAGGLCGTAQNNGDPRCPSVDIMGGLLLPSCCTDDDKCGINATMFGSMGCVELGTAAEMAKTMGGANLMWPAPRACTE
ncbi:MAG TPA: hypothetical protein VFG30_07620 [Polyangiales bacterium]|nr:hypothetical protein [Polyangiales bacterium]